MKNLFLAVLTVIVKQIVGPSQRVLRSLSVNPEPFSLQTQDGITISHNGCADDLADNSNDVTITRAS